MCLYTFDKICGYIDAYKYKRSTTIYTFRKISDRQVHTTAPIQQVQNYVEMYICC